MRLESLESRRLLATILVTTAIDENDGTFDPGTGTGTSLREAIIAANLDPEPSTITFDPSLDGTPIVLTIAGANEDAAETGDLDISREIFIVGNGPANTIISGGADINDLITTPGIADRAFDVQIGGNLTLQASTVTGGNTTADGGGVYVRSGGTATIAGSTISGNSAYFGGGIYNSGTATITDSTVSGNSATVAGGVSNGGMTTIMGTTLSENSATYSGGGVLNTGPGTATITGSTVSGNSAGDGGGIANFGTATITGSTFSGNSATYSASSSSGEGGGLLNYGSATINNTIIAGSTSGNDLELIGIAPTVTGTNNLVQDGLNLGGLTNTVTGDPLLGPLADNGGPTRTHALLPGSPAIDGGDNAVATSAGTSTDQRGADRFSGTADIGAFEVQPVMTTITVTTEIDENDGTFDPATGSGTSLREAIIAANADPGLTTITFDPSLNGVPIVLTIGGVQENSGATGDLDVTSEVVIQGNGPTNTLIDGGVRFDLNGNITTPGFGDRLLDVLTGGNLSLDQLTVAGGQAMGSFPNNDGGGVRTVSGSTLTITGSTVSGNAAAGNGGAVDNGGTTTIANSTLSGNQSTGSGGGVSSYGAATMLSIRSSTLSGNTAGGDGGGVDSGGTATITGSTVSGNAANYSGGGVNNFGTATISNTIIANSVSGGELSGSFSGTHNLVENGSGTGLLNTVTGDPRLGPLQDNGGPTFTHALLAGSPAIDAGDDTAAINAGITTDQRGENRFVGTVDIGAFELQTQVETEVTLISGVLRIQDVAGGTSNDDLTISFASGTYIITSNNGDLVGTVIPGAIGNATDRVIIPAIDVTSVLFDTLAGDDRLTIDLNGDNPIPSGGLVFDGGDPTTGTGDSLFVTGGTATTITHTFLNESDGSVDIDGSMINYTGLEPIIDNVNAVNREFTFLGGTETITLAADADNPGNNLIDSTLGESVSFANPTDSLLVSSGDGDDTISVNTLDAGFAASLLIDGGAGTADTLAMSNVNLDTSDNGRGLDLSELETINISGGAINNNTGTLGAGMLISGSTSGTTTTATLDGVTVSGNRGFTFGFSSFGGGIYTTDVNLTIQGSSLITGNSTDVNGGGVYVSGGSLSIVDSTVVGNTAGDSGGGVYANGAALTLMNSIITTNTANGADSGGGGVYLLGGGPTSPAFSITDTDFAFNTANSGGGGLEIVDNPGSISGGEYANNTVSGGVLSAEGGGGIVITALNSINSPAITIDGIEVRNNNAPAGGGIALVNPNLTILNSLIELNRANMLAGQGGFGGGIAATGDSSGGNLSFFNTDVRNNVADSSGGGIAGNDTDVRLTDTNVSSNQARDRAGGIGVQGTIFAPTLTLSRVTVDNNVADFDGGGIGAINANVDFINVTVTDNESLNGNGGGLFYQNFGSFASNSRIAFSTFASNIDPSLNSNVDAEGNSIDMLATLFADGIGVFRDGFTFNSLGYNVNNSTPPGLTDATDVISTDVNLLALGDFGGPVLTRPASDTLEVLNRVPAGLSEAIDSRGVPRSGSTSDLGDVGAFEFFGIEMTAIDVSESDATQSTPFNIDRSIPFDVTLSNSGISGSTVTSSAQNFTFAAGESTTPRSFAFTILDDDIVETDILRLVGFTSDSGPVVGSSTLANIADDDTTTLDIVDVSVDENVGLATISVISSAAVDRSFLIDYTTNVGTASSPEDYTLTFGTLTFDGSAGESQSLTIPIVNDDLAEGSEQFTVTISNVRSANLDTPIRIAGFDLSDVGSVTILDSLVPLGIGGTIFVDNAGGLSANLADQNNGFRDSSEPLFVSSDNPVVLELYRLSDPQTGFQGPSVDTLMNSTSTADGSYLFDQDISGDPLLAGSYVVVVDESQFNGGGPLFGFINSSIQSDDLDSPDQNDASLIQGIGLVSSVIDLSPGGEPDVSIDGSDTNTNSSVDFGVLPTNDLSVRTSVDLASSNLESGGNLVFDLVVENLGPLDATNVLVEQFVPFGTTFDRIELSGSSISTLSGNEQGGLQRETRFFTIDNLPVGSRAYRVFVNIDSSFIGVTESEVEIDGFEVEVDSTSQGNDPLANNFAFASVTVRATAPLTAVLSTGTGDGGVVIEVDAFGNFGTVNSLQQTFNPVGPLPALPAIFSSSLAIRATDQGPRQFLDDLPTDVQNQSTLSGDGTTANSQFILEGLNVELFQQLVPSNDPSSGQLNGADLQQSYRFSNPTSQSITLDLVRYLDADLEFNGNIDDGGGIVRDSDGNISLIISDRGGEISALVPSIRIQDEAGTEPNSNRFEINFFGDLFDRIAAGEVLSDQIAGDENNDGTIDFGSENDYAAALRRLLTIPAGGSLTYATSTVFGSFFEFDTTSQLVGTVSCDANQNGQVDFGEGVGQAMVFVDLNRNGQFDSGEEPRTFTDSLGNYSFAQVPSGDARVVLMIPEGCGLPGELVDLPTSMSLGDVVRDIVVADLDRDGIDDLLAVNDRGGELLVYQSTSGGVNGSPQPVSLSGRPHAIDTWHAAATPGDTNSNPVVHLAVATVGGGTILVDDDSGDSESESRTRPGFGAVLGFNGLVPFEVPNMGDGPIDVLVNDFDGDNEPDYVSAAFRSDEFWIKLSSQPESQLLATGDVPVQVESGYFNDDSFLDVALGSRGYGNSPGSVQILLGNGSDGFDRGPVLAMTGKLARLLSADLHQSVPADTSGGGLGGVAGGIGGVVAVSEGEWVVSGESVANGRDELLVLDESGRLRVFGLDSQSLTELESIALDAGTINLHVGDSDGDSFQDVVVVRAQNIVDNLPTNPLAPTLRAGELDILLGDGTGKFSGGQSNYSSPAFASIVDVAFGDMEGTGNDSLILANRFESNGSGDGSTTLIRLGFDKRDVVIEPTTTAEAQFSPSVMQTRMDVNGDLFVTAVDALNIINTLNAQGSNLSTTGQSEPLEGTSLILDLGIATDVNGDGQTTPLDALIVINHLNGENASSNVSSEPTKFLTTEVHLSSHEDRFDDEIIDAIMAEAGGLF